AGGAAPRAVVGLDLADARRPGRRGRTGAGAGGRPRLDAAHGRLVRRRRGAVHLAVHLGRPPADAVQPGFPHRLQRRLDHPGRVLHAAGGGRVRGERDRGGQPVPRRAGPAGGPMSSPDTGAGPRSLPAGWAAAIGLLAVLALSLLTVADLAPPAPAPATAPAGELSAERAQRHIEQIARAPHPMGAEEHTRVREYLVAELRDLGLEPEVQEAVGVSPEEFGGAASV